MQELEREHEIGREQSMDTRTLSREDVVAIHEALVADFADTTDPIAPPGIKSIDLLESAVSRQHTALGGRLKYTDPVSNAATLLYGICCDHAFHNGNKRTAVVAMLVHLDENHLVLDTNQRELFAMILAVANHTLGVREDPRRPDKTPLHRKSDEEVEAIADWLSRRISRVVRGERQLTYRELRRLLENFGFHLVKPYRNYIDIVRYEDRRTGLLRRRVERVAKRVGSMGWPGEHEVVGIGEIKRVRRLLGLTEADGVDSGSFYDRAAVIDAFVNRYRTLLRRLARR